MLFTEGRDRRAAAVAAAAWMTEGLRQWTGREAAARGERAVRMSRVRCARGTKIWEFGVPTKQRQRETTRADRLAAQGGRLVLGILSSTQCRTREFGPENGSKPPPPC